MAEDVRVSADGTRVLVVSSGAPSLEEMGRTLSKIAELRRDYKIGSVLVDSRARRGQPSVAEIFAGGKLLAETLGPGIRIAVLVSDVTADHTLFEDVAVNRGGTVAFFSDEKLAAQWLSRASP